ncbi:hypothetical protein QVD17_17725 [Tagetes erecta]|uniref:HMG box domain-containing protein n=1 Tax=Tagetes erecta TaxID=13708 RepID=A0AAD8KSS4_TARER|nr:hypothetical protein QVD17_17725 [Tagetes erecta]
MILFLIQLVGKAGSDKWKSMSAAEKAPYVAKAENRKSEYDKTLKAYDKKLMGSLTRHDAMGVNYSFRGSVYRVRRHLSNNCKMSDAAAAARKSVKVTVRCVGYTAKELKGFPMKCCCCCCVKDDKGTNAGFLQHASTFVGAIYGFFKKTKNNNGNDNGNDNRQ